MSQGGAWQGGWVHTSVILTFGKLRQEDHCELKASLNYVRPWTPKKGDNNKPSEVSTLGGRLR